jgi:ketosteroid isomerase-like protein
MHSGSVELVHEAVDCFRREDWEGLGALIAPDAVMTPFEGWPDPGPFLGREAHIREYKRLADAIRRTEIVSVDDVVGYEDWVVVHFRSIGEESEGDIPVGEFIAVHRFEAGLFAESHYRFDRDAAFAAAGL